MGERRHDRTTTGAEKTKAVSQKKRTFGAVEFRYYDSIEGRFANLLPVKPGDEPSAIVH